jgi:hypothetical protein
MSHREDSGQNSAMWLAAPMTGDALSSYAAVQVTFSRSRQLRFAGKLMEGIHEETTEIGMKKPLQESGRGPNCIWVALQFFTR